MAGGGGDLRLLSFCGDGGVAGGLCLWGGVGFASVCGMMRLPLSCALVALMSWSVVCGAAEPLRIGAWNLEFYGQRNDPPRTDADRDAIAAKVRELGIDVLAVGEINGRDRLEDLAERIGPSWRGVLGTTGIFSEEPFKQLGVGFLWDSSKVELINAGEFSALPRYKDGLPVYHRVPVTAAFRAKDGGPDFRLVAVHLKAGMKPNDSRKRTIELEGLRGRLEAMLEEEGEDGDVIVLGDFNHDTRAAESRVLTGEGFATYPAGEGQTIIHFEEQIDHIVPLAGFDEVDVATFRIHNDGMEAPGEWRRVYSDHFPVTIDLRPVPDDDPESEFAPADSALRPVGG
jgi:endonuclease/exonuclease/phosphatase family metal-dependent hydrolase